MKVRKDSEVALTACQLLHNSCRLCFLKLLVSAVVPGLERTMISSKSVSGNGLGSVSTGGHTKLQLTVTHLLFSKKALVPELQFREEMAIDPKPAAQRTLLRSTEAQHVFETLAGAASAKAKGEKIFCWKHEDFCRVPHDNPDCFICGFPCAPYSSQRSGRFQQEKGSGSQMSCRLQLRRPASKTPEVTLWKINVTLSSSPKCSWQL